MEDDEVDNIKTDQNDKHISLEIEKKSINTLNQINIVNLDSEQNTKDDNKDDGSTNQKQFSTEESLKLIFNMEKISWNTFFTSASNFLNDYVGNLKIKDIFQDFFTKFSNELSIPNLDSPNLTILEKISLYQNKLAKKKQEYFGNFLGHFFLQNLLDQSLFTAKYREMLNKYSINDGTLNFDPDILKYNCNNSTYKLEISDDLNFILNKKYGNEVTAEVKDRERSILTEKYSKFIIRAEITPNNIVIPYFPIGTLEELFFNQLHLTSVDKIVMILEIATALKDLHSHNEYHGNLSHQFIFINSSKDAYIGSFCYDQCLETDSSKLRGPYYYRAPEIRKGIHDQNEQMADIYSFGVLMHEIVTEKTPESRFGNRPRKERLEILKNEKEKSKNTSNFIDYCDFLFKEGGGNEVFEDNYKDEEGNSFKGMKEIIEKCMKTETTERYSSFKELIGCIEALPIYTKNKEEIEFRIKHAIDAREYQCTISDLVESYYRGQTESKADIEQFLSVYAKCIYQSNNETVQITESVVKTIFDTFGIKYDEDFSQHFEVIFNLVINRFYHVKLSRNQSVVDEEDYLLKLSREANLDEEEGREIIIPRIPSKMYSSEELVSKGQRKDIKNFIKIAEKLGIPPTILSKIQESETMNEIVFHLYNFIRNNSNKKQLEIFERNYSSCSYSSFVITYPIIEEVFHHIEDNDYSFEGLAIDFENIYQMMNGLLDNIESHPENSIKANLPPFITSTNMTQAAERIADLIKNVKIKCSALFDFVQSQKEPTQPPESITISIDDSKVTVKKTVKKPVKRSIGKDSHVLYKGLENFSLPRKLFYDEQSKKKINTRVDRYIGFTLLFRQTAHFLLRRCIFNLNPLFKYKLIIRLNNQKMAVSNDQILVLKDFKKFVKKIKRVSQDPFTKDGNIIVLVDNDESVNQIL
ncbi:hypothetical protein M9Y10_038039 [Tritrichomonas musculus]|uniref:Protein kinase domain-containing protein n=1 Tax=Tritrichomonas musculus TaxID=1915356 RepID=A0ABR2K7H2_9EUKA